jgi:hypothetical protein
MPMPTSVAMCATIVLLGGCEADSFVCATIGDSTRLTVQLSARPTGPYTVDVTPNRSTSTTPVTYTFRCDGLPLSSARGAFFPGAVEQHFRVRVTTTVGVRETRLHDVRYTDRYPNSERCEPRTPTATVPMQFPE